MPTPSLLVDEPRMVANIRRLNEHLAGLGVPLRPHLKTCKNIEIAREMLAGHPGGATVSTLAEADYFYGHGIRDLLYAVGIAPGKLDGVSERLQPGMALTLILDHPDAARAVAEAAKRLETRFRVLLEVDADGHRAGFLPDDDGLLESARILAGAAQRLREAGFEAPVVSVGSTPTMAFARDLTGVTETCDSIHILQDLFASSDRPAHKRAD